MKRAKYVSAGNNSPDDSFSLDIKRLCLPAQVTWTCPHCLLGQVWHIEGDYLSYPMVNDWEEHTVNCNDCDEESSLELKLTINIEAR